jgi:hypothetical protein
MLTFWRSCNIAIRRRRKNECSSRATKRQKERLQLGNGTPFLFVDPYDAYQILTATKLLFARRNG